MASPFIKKPQYSACGVKPLKLSGRPQQERRVVPTIRIAQPMYPIVILRKEQCRIRAINRVLVKQPVYRFQKLCRLLPCGYVLAAEVRLQICHQQRSWHALARNVSQYESQPLWPQAQEIEVIASHFAGRDAQSTIIE